MLTQDQYQDALTIARSYANLNPAPDSRYGRRLAELRVLIAEYEQASGKLTHPDVQRLVDRKRGAQ